MGEFVTFINDYMTLPILGGKEEDVLNARKHVVSRLVKNSQIDEDGTLYVHINSNNANVQINNNEYIDRLPENMSFNNLSLYKLPNLQELPKEMFVYGTFKMKCCDNIKSIPMTNVILDSKITKCKHF